MNQILQGDARLFLPGMPASIVDVIVTSPRYNFGKNYPGVNDKTSSEVYFDEMHSLAKGLLHVGKPDVACFLNVGTRGADPLHDVHVAEEFLRAGWVLQERIIWQKATEDGRGHFTPISSERYLNNLWESIFLFTKDGKLPLDRLAIGVPYTDQSNIKRWNSGKSVHCRGDVWHIPPGVHPEDARWLALLVDTEGSITVNISNAHAEGRSTAHNPVISIANCDLKLLEYAQKLADGHGRIYNKPPTAGAIVQSNHPVYSLVFSASDVYTLLTRIYPWLITKKRQARAALHLSGLKQSNTSRARLSGDDLEEREVICNTIKALNHREDVDDSWIPDPYLVSDGGDVWFMPYDTIQDRARDRQGHEATFPRELVVRCLRLVEHGRKGLRVLDPCCGTGTVPLVAVEQGHHGIGIDLSPEIAEEAARALADVRPMDPPSTP